MAAGRAQRIAGGDDARADGIAIVDRLLEADVVAIGRADVADGGEAGVEHGAGIADRGHAEEGIGKFQPAIAADVGRPVEVDVHVDQAGDEGAARQVDVADVGAPFDGARVGDGGDAAVVADEDGGIIDIAAGRDIEIAIGGDDALFSGGGGDEQKCRQCDADRSNHAIPLLLPREHNSVALRLELHELRTTPGSESPSPMLPMCHHQCRAWSRRTSWSEIAQTEGNRTDFSSKP